MRQILASVGSLLLGVGLLMLASGMFGTFLGLRSAQEGFSREVVGLMMSAYYAGLILGTLNCGRLVNRIGHIRAFATFCGLIAASAIVFPFAVSAPVWIALRAVFGFSMAGLFMVSESWLNDRSTPQTRGTVLSLYMMVSYLAMGSGQFIINLGDPSGPDLFMITSILFSLALIPVAVTRATTPAPVEASRFGFRELYEISPTAVLGCLAAGLCSGAVYGMGPIYAQELGLSVVEISQFMGIIIISGLFLQLPIGRLSDRFDRRRVILLVAIATAAASFSVVFVMRWDVRVMMTPAGPISTIWQSHQVLLQAIAAAYGGFVATLYPLSVAYANDYIEPKDMVQATGGLVLAFGIGAAVGPISAAAIMQVLGPEGLFMFTGAVVVLLTAFIIHRMRCRQWVAIAEKESFVLMPEASTTPVAMELDPRTECSQVELPSDNLGEHPKTGER